MALAASRPGLTVLHVAGSRDLARSVEAALSETVAVRSLITRYDTEGILTDLREFDVDCLLSGYDLRGTTGIALHERVEATAPDLPTLLYASGGTDGIDRSNREATAVLPVEEATRPGPLGARLGAILADGSGEPDLDDRAGDPPPRGGTDARKFRQFEKAVEHAGHAIVVTDVDGQIEYVNPAFEEITGYAAEEAIGANPRLLQSGEHDEPFYERMWETILAGDVWESEIVNERADGRRFVVDQTVAPISNDEGAITGFVAVNDDVTDRREREEQLRRYETAVEATWDGLAALDENLSFTFVNERFATAAGFDRAELLAHADLSTMLDAGVIEKEGYRRLYVAAGEVLSGDRSERRLEVPVTSPIEGEQTVEIRLAPIEDGEIEGVVATIRNVTDRKRREEQLEARNDSLEEFASVVSHDLRNPLNVAKNRLALARHDRDDDHLAKVADAHDRMETLIEDLLELATEGEAIDEPERVGLRAVATDAWAGIETRAAALRIDGDVAISADRARLRQLLANLFRNAIEHAGPAVTVTIGPLPDGEGFFVADDGPGVPPERRDGIFETGYTTAQKGTGYGLSIVTQIAEAHGWAVSVCESAGGGARFEVRGVERPAEDPA